MVNHWTLFFLKNLFFQLIDGLTWQVDVIKKRFYISFEVTDNITDANSECLGCGLGGLMWFGGGLGLTWQVDVIKML